MKHLALLGFLFTVFMVGLQFFRGPQSAVKPTTVATTPPEPPEVPAKPRKELAIRAELFEKCHRALVEYEGDVSPLRTEIRLIRFKVKEGDEKALLGLFEQAAKVLECKSLVAGLAVVAEDLTRKISAEKNPDVVKMWQSTPLGVQSRYWRERRLVSLDEKHAEQLKQVIPDLEIIAGESTTFMGTTYPPSNFISYEKVSQLIDEKLKVLEASIGAALSLSG